MATTSHKAYRGVTSALTTELNSLGNGSNTAASSAIDNTSNLDLFMDLELNLGAAGSARSAGAIVSVYMVTAVDGSNYPDVNETTAELVAVFPLDAATTARRCAVRDVPMPPALFKLFVRNSTGQALNASGNTLKYNAHSITTA